MRSRIHNRCRQAVVLVSLTLIGSISTTLADSGDLDPAFGAGGIVNTDITLGDDRAQRVAVLADGKMLVAGTGIQNGNEVQTIAKFLPDGSLDSAFGTNGKVIGPSGTGYGLAIQTDGKFVVAGYVWSGTRFDILVTRYHPNGSLDSDFSGDGVVITNVGGSESQAYAVVIQPDDKILVGGYSGLGGAFDFALLRFNPDGSPDTSFSGDGKVVTSVTSGDDRAYSLALQTDGKILLAGSGGSLNDGGLEIVRYDSAGDLDTTFGVGGIVFLDDVTDCRAVCIQADKKILVSGAARVGTGTTYDFAVARFNDDGSLDPSFSEDGIVYTNLRDNDDRSTCMSLDLAGRIVVGGTSLENNTSGRKDYALVRYKPNGTLDLDFSRDGKIITEMAESDDFARSLVVQPNDMVVVAGFTQAPQLGGYGSYLLARYEGHDTDGDGLNDSVETNTGTYLFPTQTGTDPFNPDSDDDGLIDGLEVSRYGSSPLNRDSDGDGFDDGFEVSTGFDPTSHTSVPLTTSIILTAVEFRFLAPAGKVLKIEASTDLQSWYSIENDIAGTGTTLTRFYSVQTIPKRYFRVTEQ